MELRERVSRLIDGLGAGLRAGVGVKPDALRVHRARVDVEHRRWSKRSSLWALVGEPEVAWNLITDAGRVFIHTQAYATSGIGSNGLNYIALSNDTLTETASSTTLSNEIAANGLSRAQGTVTLPTGTGTQTTVAKTFTCATAPQAAQKAALFTASSSGTMCHVASFTQRSLQIGDQLVITFTLTIA